MVSNDYILSLKNISLENDSTSILSNIDITLRPSEIHCILGKYGSGKSQLAKILRGRLKPTGGRISISNQEYTYLKIKDSLKLGISVLQHEDRFQENIRIKEFLYEKYHSSNLTYLSPKIFDHNFVDIAKKYNLRFNKNTEVGELTSSERYFLGIIKILETKPKIIILDEILDKIENQFLVMTLQLLEKEKRKGAHILIITNNIDEVYNFAERVSIMKSGKIIYTDLVKNIEKINLIKLAYAEISKQDQEAGFDHDFHQLLKFNEAILLELPLNLIIVDKSMKVKIANNNARIFYDLENTTFSGSPLEELFRDNPHVLSIIEEAFQKREAKVIYNSVLSFEEHQIVTNIKTYPIFDGPDFIGFIIALEDVTVQENIRKQLFMSENLASIGLLSAGVAHEINNPLEIISNCTSYLRYNIEDKILLGKIQAIENEVSSISSIISNLVGISHNKSSRIERFDICELISTLINLLSKSLSKQEIEIHFSTNASEINVFADMTEIKQIFINLIRNSMEAIQDNGNIYITINSDDSTNIEATIRDDGNGIDDKMIDNLFLPFYSTKYDLGKNQGLGLYIIYGIIKKYYGEIEARNLDSGSEFRIRLPILAEYKQRE